MSRRCAVAAGVLLAILSLAGAARPAGSTAASRPPVVMIVFDEFSTTSLLDAHGNVDRVRYPAFASLAREGTWFPNATASVDETGRAMEALLTGSTPKRSVPAWYRFNPHNVFTLLGGRYRVNASEEVTSMCPRRLCPGVREKTRTIVLHELAGGRPERFAAWVNSIRRGGPPKFMFKHALLPHVPMRYLPSGLAYASGPKEKIGGMLEDFRERWPIQQAYQRHLLQVGFTDRLLGTALRRLRDQGLYDRSLIVVTADNGESFGRVGNRHEISHRNAVDIALTPLFIKRPGQRRGRVVHRRVRTVDVLPTIAHVLHMHVPWRTHGRSVFGASARRIPGTVTMSQRSGRRIVIGFRSLRRGARAALRRKLRLFGSGSAVPGLYGIGSSGLLGKQVGAFPVRSGRRLRATSNEEPSLQDVDPRSGKVPSYLTGRIVGGRRHETRPLAIAVNGVIAATPPSFHLFGRGPELYSALVPEVALMRGRNRLQLFSIQKGRKTPHLVALH